MTHLDPSGNVTEKSTDWSTVEYEYNAANQLTQVGERSYQYDQNGNLIKKELYGHSAEYSYNYKGQTG